MKLSQLLVCGALGFASVSGAMANSELKKNMFIAYYSQKDVAAMADFAKQQKLGGFILWEMRGDTTYGSSTSLLSSLKKQLGDYKAAGQLPMVMDYWTDWGVYSNDSSSRAIPEPAYPVPGSLTTGGIPVTGAAVNDFSAKLAGINTLAYSFVEAQTHSYTYYNYPTRSMVTIPNKHPEDMGTLYFNDAWSDLLVPGKNAQQDAFCGSGGDGKSIGSKVCWFGMYNRNSPVAPAAGAMMGNFDAFTQLKHADPNNQLGPLHKVISVGGYGHDASFEDAFSLPNDQGVHNFVNSAAALIKAFNLSGIDLDYENPNMTHQQSQRYLDLITQLRAALPDTAITVTILADPNYLQGVRSGVAGFDRDVLQQIAAQVNHIDLMTYDFHGAFDYNPNGSGTTGFLTNLYMPNDAPSGYRFSVAGSVAALLTQGVPANKVVVGIPAYGRSLAHVAAKNGGLFQSLTADTLIPRGDLDMKTCGQAITPMGWNTCGGMFTYNYIVNHLLMNGFKVADRTDNAAKVSNGTTAYHS
ncbi:MAG: glycosyl hydrolase family 18 protein [Coxiellaceae bacterium]|nr:glycosyl hydrolase family 18 protein [Coxiellaceae bacterium]